MQVEKLDPVQLIQRQSLRNVTPRPYRCTLLMLVLRSSRRAQPPCLFWVLSKAAYRDRSLNLSVPWQLMHLYGLLNHINPSKWTKPLYTEPLWCKQMCRSKAPMFKYRDAPTSFGSDGTVQNAHCNTTIFYWPQTLLTRRLHLRRHWTLLRLDRTQPLPFLQNNAYRLE